MIRRLARRFKTWIEPAPQINLEATIVFGKEKCGTTAIAALLAKRTSRSVTLDIPPVWNEEETKIRWGQSTLSSFMDCHPAYFSKDIVKEPCLTFIGEQVFELFPRGKHVLVIRDPRDNIRSIFNRIGFRGDLQQVSDEARGNIPAGWETVVDQKWNGSPDENYVDVQAHRWNWASRIVDISKRLVVIRYEDFMKNKIEAIDQLANELHLKTSGDISKDVDRQYQPQGDRDVSWIDFFGKENLKRIESICGEQMKKFGYEVPDSA